MNPDPQNPADANKSTSNALIEAFTKLPPLLSYGGLILVAGIVILSLTDVLPDQLLWTPLVALAAFLIYTFINRWFDLQEKKVDAQPSPSPAKPATTTTPQLDPDPKRKIAKEAPDAAEWQRRYLKHLIKLCGYPPSMALIDIKEAGFGSEKLALEKIFTALDVPHQQHLRQDIHHLSEKELRRMTEKQRESALAALSRIENDRLVILGAPGSGKSTLINYLTLCLAGDHLQSKRINQDQLRALGWSLSRLRLWPVRVILREYAARGLTKKQSVWNFIAAELSRETVKLARFLPHLKKRLQQEGGILLLDGLDEVDKATQIRQQLKNNIELFARNFPKVRVVVTSRPYAYGSGWELSGFQVTRLLPFSEEQIEAFIEQWYTVMGQQDGTLGPEKAESYQKGLINQVKRNRNLAELAQHPLLLTMMVYIHRGREGGALPQRREKLYELSVVLLLDLWRRSKTVPGQETQTLAEVLGMDIDLLKKALAEVAFMAHRDQKDQEQTADIPGALLAGILYKHARKSDGVGVEQLIEYVRDRAGLLEAHGRNADDSDDVYRFPHRTFQEYLAGQHLLWQRFPYDLAKLTREDPGRWRECLLLAAASEKDRPSLVWLLVAALCEEDAATPALDNKAALWGAFLAGQTLLETELTEADDAQIETEQSSRQRIWQWQKKIINKGLLPPRERALAGEALAALGDDRPGVLRCDEMQLCTVPAGSFWLDSWQKGQQGGWYDGLNKPYWLGQLPVTTAQFREFVADSGFKPRYGQESLRGAGNLPVAFVNWYDALAFCNWLDARWRAAGWLPDGYRVTLPSEVEWEKGARGGQEIPAQPVAVAAPNLPAVLANLPALQENLLPQRSYPWGDAPEEEESAPEQTIYRANNENAGIGSRCVVGSFPQGGSPVGCLDLSGQVWEWTRSMYGKKLPYQQSREYETMSSSNKERMVLRGGSFYDNQNGCSVRVRYDPHLNILVDRGVRVCVSPFTSGL
jgi:formylglycine-generating enzyme required for sulfatase activity/energy-coupling factor transporter ATP-binding protein EcfA2